jgi:hypothetical protein
MPPPSCRRRRRAASKLPLPPPPPLRCCAAATAAAVVAAAAATSTPLIVDCCVPVAVAVTVAVAIAIAVTVAIAVAVSHPSIAHRVLPIELIVTFLKVVRRRQRQWKHQRCYHIVVILVSSFVMLLHPRHLTPLPSPPLLAPKLPPCPPGHHRWLIVAFKPLAAMQTAALSCHCHCIVVIACAPP